MRTWSASAAAERTHGDTMRVWITGICGFVGRHLASELAAHGHAVEGFDRAAPAGLDAPVHVGELTRTDDVRAALKAARPDACVHLAGVASVGAAARDPAACCDVNVRGTLNVLDALRTTAPACRTLVISTAHVYGDAPAGAPLDEDTPFRPGNLYALTKAMADEAARYFARVHGLPVMVARPVNHIGPGQTAEYVIGAFAARLSALAHDGGPAELRTGNLDSRRDFMDVRDTVRAYRLLLERGRPGRAYNLASGRSERIGVLLEQLCALAGAQPRIVTDPALFRPTDTTPALALDRIRADTGWRCEIPLEQTLREIYAAARGA